MHLFDPIAEAVHDHTADDGMIGLQCVSSTAVVGITRAVLFEKVVCAVVDSTKAHRWPVVCAFGCVIKYDIQDNFYVRTVECLDHVTKLIH